MDLHNYSVTQEYEFEILPNDLGYFQKRAWINEKIANNAPNTMLYMNQDKLLSVVVESDSIGWLPYHKAKLFLDLFSISIDQKFVLISENDQFFYGFIDLFPCVFKANKEEAEAILAEYSEGEPIYYYGIGQTSLNCLQVKSFAQVCFSLNLAQVEEKHNFVMESSEEYYTSEEIQTLSPYSNLFFRWLIEVEKMEKASKKRATLYVGSGLLFIVLGYFLSIF